MKCKRISNLERFMIVFMIAFFSFSGMIKAQMVGANAYIKATSVEIGIAGAGGFEGCDVTVSPPLPGMHYRSGTNFFGFVANPQVNSWATFDGDFFTPGSPENGWGFEIGTGGVSAGNNCNFLNQINGSLTNWSHNSICYSADWEGDYTSGTNLHFKINYFLQETDLYYTTTVSITNNTAATISNMYYYRNLDPDNNQPLSTIYDTQNTIVSQPGSGCNLAHVSATQPSPWVSYLGLAAIGANWRAVYGGFSNRDASNLWTGTGLGPFTQTVGATTYADEAIALAYRIQNLAPGATETFKFVVILDDAAATNAINNLLYFSYPGAAGAPSSGCSAVSDTVGTCGSSVAIAVQGSNVTDYTWSWSPVTGLSSTTGPSVIANPPVTTVYTATGTPVSACVSPVTMSVVVEITPGAGANPVIDPVPPLCISSPPVTLTADSLGGTWSGTGITNDTTGLFDPAVSGIGNFMVTYSTPGGCNTTDTVMVTVGSTYDATIIHPPSICITGSPVTLSSITNGGTWSGTGITSGTAGTFDPATAGLGIHVITYSISGVCADSDTDSIEVTSLFDATITQPADLCQYSAPITLTSAHPDGYWFGTGITDSITGSFNPVIAGPQTITYTIPGSCGNADTVVFNVLPTPEVTINPVPPLCLSSPAITLTADSTGGVWAGTGITNASLGTFNPSIAGLGTHLITYSTTGLCSTLDTIFIQITTFSDATINPIPSVCILGSAVTLTAVTAGGNWSGPGITGAATAGNFDPSVAGLGTHLITYNITGSCANTDTVLVEVVNIFDATITQPADVCVGSPSYNLVSAHPGGVYSGVNISDANLGTITPLTVGTYPVTYTISGLCSNSSTINVSVLPNADATITSVPPMCYDGGPVALTGVTSGGTWTGPGTTSSGTFDPLLSGSGTFIITYGVAGTCGDTATSSITVNPLPVPNFTSDVNSGCNPLCVQFLEGASPLCSSIHYDFGDGDTSNVSAPYHCYDSSAVFHVTVTCTDINGCRGTTIDSNMITVNPVPTAAFAISPVPDAAINTAVSFTNGSTTGTTALWTFGDGSPFNNSSVLFNTSHVYSATGTMCATLIATTPAGCSDTISHCVEIVDPAIDPPNIFTPNGDNDNDTWSMRCPGIAEFNCVVYDRWGMKMTEMNSVSEAEHGWDGKTKSGGICKDGTYYFIIKATTVLDKPIEKAGFFQLLGN
jgi:gliding motility-associated-like protein